MLPLMNQYEMQKIRLDGKLEGLDGLNSEISVKKEEKKQQHELFNFHRPRMSSVVTF